MKKILCLAIAIMLMLTCVGCEGNTSETIEDDKENTNASMFVLVEQQLLYGYRYKVVYHKDTKVMYVMGQYNEFEVMLDADGKPLLWEG